MSAAALLLALAVGAHVSWIDDATGKPQCGVVTYIDAEGPGGVPWVWMFADGLPKSFYVRRPLRDVKAGCPS